MKKKCFGSIESFGYPGPFLFLKTSISADDVFKTFLATWLLSAFFRCLGDSVSWTLIVSMGVILARYKPVFGASAVLGKCSMLPLGRRHPLWEF